MSPTLPLTLWRTYFFTVFNSDSFCDLPKLLFDLQSFVYKLLFRTDSIRKILQQKVYPIKISLGLHYIHFMLFIYIKSLKYIHRPKQQKLWFFFRPKTKDGKNGCIREGWGIYRILYMNLVWLLFVKRNDNSCLLSIEILWKVIVCHKISLVWQELALRFTNL